MFEDNPTCDLCSEEMDDCNCRHCLDCSKHMWEHSVKESGGFPYCRSCYDAIPADER